MLPPKGRQRLGRPKSVVRHSSPIVQRPLPAAGFLDLDAADRDQFARSVQSHNDTIARRGDRKPVRSRRMSSESRRIGQPAQGICRRQESCGAVSASASARIASSVAKGPIRIRRRVVTYPPTPRATPRSRAIERMYVPLPHSISSSRSGHVYSSSRSGRFGLRRGVSANCRHAAPDRMHARRPMRAAEYVGGTCSISPDKSRQCRPACVRVQGTALGFGVMVPSASSVSLVAPRTGCSPGTSSAWPERIRPAAWPDQSRGRGRRWPTGPTCRRDRLVLRGNQRTTRSTASRDVMPRGLSMLRKPWNPMPINGSTAAPGGSREPSGPRHSPEWPLLILGADRHFRQERDRLALRHQPDLQAVAAVDGEKRISSALGRPCRRPSRPSSWRPRVSRHCRL